MTIHLQLHACTNHAYPQNNKFTSLQASLAARVRGVKPMLFITVLSGFPH